MNSRRHAINILPGVLSTSSRHTPTYNALLFGKTTVCYRAIPDGNRIHSPHPDICPGIPDPNHQRFNTEVALFCIQSQPTSPLRSAPTMCLSFAALPHRNFPEVSRPSRLNERPSLAHNHDSGLPVFPAISPPFCYPFPHAHILVRVGLGHPHLTPRQVLFPHGSQLALHWRLSFHSFIYDKQTSSQCLPAWRSSISWPRHPPPPMSSFHTHGVYIPPQEFRNIITTACCILIYVGPGHPHYSPRDPLA